MIVLQYGLHIPEKRAIWSGLDENETCAAAVTNDLNTDPIDAVITWVDGANPAHRKRRGQYMAQGGQALNENASNPHRWESRDEIYYCLHSIHTHAPWLRRIWIVVEEEAPDLSTLPNALRDKIHIVVHAEIFAGHTHVLPTFNSLAIESVMWRIDGLAERFLYFNDDVFLTSTLEVEDVFVGHSAVLRGEWVDYAALLQDVAARDDPAQFAEFMHINGAALCGYGASHLFACAHVVHPLRRSVMEKLFAEHGAAFTGNISHRFRDLSQFLPQGAHTHASIRRGEYVVSEACDHLHITSGQGMGLPAEKTRALLTAEGLKGIKFLCVNDLPQLEALVPDAPVLLGHAVGMT